MAAIGTWYLQLFGQVKLLKFTENTKLDLEDGIALSNIERTLLAYLSENNLITRQEAQNLFWPEDDSESAKKKLRNLLYRFNQKVEAVLQVDNESIVLQNSETDIEHFQRSEEDGGIEALEKVVTLYQGQFYSDFSSTDLFEYEAWLETTRQYWQDRFIAILSNLSKLYSSERRLDDAIGVIRRWLELVPWQEEAHRQLMQLYQQKGDRNSIIKQYEACCQQLAEELGLPPDTQTQLLYQRLLHKSADYEGEIVPVQLTSFVGRETELEDLNQLLLNNRLISILGFGGIGKTRLALKLAEQSIGKFRDGIFFVSLANHTAEEIPGLIARELGVTVNDKPTGDISAAKKDKHFLLILDNFEHVMVMAKFVQELLVAIPQMKIVVTSRDRLKLKSESLYPLQGLDIPDESCKNPTDYSVVRLFTQRSKSVNPSFTITSENQLNVIRICRITQGVPLAVELAASWVRTMSVNELANAVEKSVSILETDNIDVPNRQQSVHRVFDYSWSLLSDLEKNSLLATSVFVNGFNRDSAQKVCGISPLILASLVDKSLIKFEQQRYSLHPLIKEIIAEKLEQDAKANREFTEKHALFFREFANSYFDQLYDDSKSKAATQILSKDLGNLTKAWYWELLQSETPERSKLFNAIHNHYLHVQPNSVEIIRHMKQAIELREKIEPDSLKTYKLYRNYALFLASVGKSEDALTHAKKAYNATSELTATDSKELSYMQFGLVNSYLSAGYYSKAKTLSLKSRLDTTHASFGELECHRFYQLGKACASLGEVACAEASFKEAVRLDEVHSPISEQFSSKQALTEFYIDYGMLKEAKAGINDLYELIEKTDSKHFKKIVWSIETSYAFQAQQADQALEYAKKCVETLKSSSSLLNRASTLQLLAQAQAMKGDYVALQNWQEALLLAKNTQCENIVLYIISNIIKSNLHSKTSHNSIVELANYIYKHPKSYFISKKQLISIIDDRSYFQSTLTDIKEATELTFDLLRQSAIQESSITNNFMNDIGVQIPWEEIMNVLPPQPTKGRKRTQDKEVLNGLIFMKQTGKGFNDLPRTPDYASPSTTRRWLEKWMQEGILDNIEKHLPPNSL